MDTNRNIWEGALCWLWSIFGNDDEPFPPAGYVAETSSWPNWYRQFVWLFIRNPLHNFCFYRIGFVGKPFTRVGLYPNDVFNPRGGWNICQTLYEEKWYGFKSYTGTGFIKKYYRGWREKGNFGIKLNLNWWWWSK